MDFNLLSAMAAYAMLVVFGLPGALASKSKGGGTTISCETGWYVGGTKCFKVVLDSAAPTASQSRTACTGMGSGITLACPRSQDEMFGFFQAVYPLFVTTTTDRSFWLGINDEDTERGSAKTEWSCYDQTEGTGNYSYWDGEYPSSSAGIDCAYLDTGDFLVWQDNACTNTRNGYVCEKAP